MTKYYKHFLSTIYGTLETSDVLACPKCGKAGRVIMTTQGHCQQCGERLYPKGQRVPLTYAFANLGVLLSALPEEDVWEMIRDAVNCNTQSLQHQRDIIQTLVEMLMIPFYRQRMMDNGVLDAIMRSQASNCAIGAFMERLTKLIAAGLPINKPYNHEMLEFIVAVIRQYADGRLDWIAAQYAILSAMITETEEREKEETSDASSAHRS